MASSNKSEMNHNDANGFDFGSSNTDIDPAVLRGKLEALDEVGSSPY
jgi:hypothetical protein